ncbi:sterol desaturase family protein [Sphingomonas sp. ID0503]|uniref:sterol desaturase family protein n=1 Tax=Sphingomonas sp. ID0503 TaxID=3399691 RepID=UPI003AFB658B
MAVSIYHYIIFVLFAIFVVVERLTSARDYPEVRLWRALGLASTLLYFAITTCAPFLWDAWLSGHRLIDATGLPFVVQVVAGFLLLELGIYGWHRAMHRSDVIWRAHQMHHAAERVDIWGAFYFHPLDMIGWALLGSLCLVGIVGLTPEATLAVNVLATFCSMFQHANIRTPRWIGYVVARPESHAIHHERGVHAFNYGDIPLWDMVFGTFRNPASWDGKAGFDAGSTGTRECWSGRRWLELPDQPFMHWKASGRGISLQFQSAFSYLAGRSRR